MLSFTVVLYLYDYVLATYPRHSSRRQTEHSCHCRTSRQLYTVHTRSEDPWNRGHLKDHNQFIRVFVCSPELTIQWTFRTENFGANTCLVTYFMTLNIEILKRRRLDLPSKLPEMLYLGMLTVMTP